MAKKQIARIRNWGNYNKSLVKRGSLTFWLDSNAIAGWYEPEKSGERGRSNTYSDLAIETCLVFKALFGLPLRATQGFVASLFELMSVPLSVPDYTRLCRRQSELKCQLPKSVPNKAMHIVIDSTGLKIHGEGEWKIRTHGKDKRRTWLKLHLAIDESTHDIQACMVTGADVHDCEVLGDLLDQIEADIAQVTADGAYDTHDCYAAAVEREAVPCFPPRKNACRNMPKDEAMRLRNHTVSAQLHGELKKWKKDNNYHRRSLAETAMFRFKQLFGGGVASRTAQNQATEVAIKCKIINRMNSLGMPDYQNT